MLGTDPFGQSRITINTNIDALGNEINNFELVFGISLISGNMDVSGATGGVIKAKQLLGNSLQLPATGPAVVTADGTSGIVACNILNAATSVNTATVSTTTLTVLSSGAATFASPATFNALGSFLSGFSRGAASDIGLVTAYTVNNYNNVIIFDAAASQAVVLTAGSLVDGHEIILIYKGSNTGVNIPAACLVGGRTATFAVSSAPYACSVTLVYQASSGLWLVTAAVNVVVS